VTPQPLSEAEFDSLSEALERLGTMNLEQLDPTLTCAVQRRDFPVGDRPTRQLSLRPVAIGAVVEVTKRLKPLV